MDLSICIVSFNTRETLERTLRAALADASGLKAEVIVVDNGSRDGTPRMIRDSFPSVELIPNPDNRFFTAGLNQALARARGRLALALNSDAEILPGTIPGLVAYLGSHPEVGAATTRMVFPDGRLQRNCSRFPTFVSLLLEHTLLGRILTGPRRRIHRWMWYDEWDRTTERAVEVAPGSFLLTRTELIRSLGALDERFRLYFSDDDWCRRLNAAGLQVIYSPRGGVVHPEGTSTRRIRPLAQQIFFEDMRAYAEKHFGKGRARILWLLSWPTRWGMARGVRPTLD